MLPATALCLGPDALLAGALLRSGPLHGRLGGLTRAGIAQLVSAGLIDGGRLTPDAVALVDLVCFPALAATVARASGDSGDASAGWTQVWARPDRAVLGVVDRNGTAEFRDVDPRRLADHLLGVIAMGAATPPTAGVEAAGGLLAALLTGDGPRATAVLDRVATTGPASVEPMIAVLSGSPTAWRIAIRWRDDRGERGGLLQCLDAGALGWWLVTSPAAGLALEPVDQDGLRARVQALLPSDSAAPAPIAEAVGGS